MNWDALGAIAELLGAIAVFLTLAYLTVQVKQISKALALQNQFSAAQIMQARTDTMMHVCDTVLSEEKNMEAIQIFHKTTLDSEISGLDEETLSRIRIVLDMHRGMFENLFDQYKSGFLSKSFYEGSPTKNLTRLGPAIITFGTGLSEELETEIRRVLAL